MSELVILRIQLPKLIINLRMLRSIDIIIRMFMRPIGERLVIIVKHVLYISVLLRLWISKSWWCILLKVVVILAVVIILTIKWEVILVIRKNWVTVLLLRYVLQIIVIKRVLLIDILHLLKLGKLFHASVQIKVVLVISETRRYLLILRHIVRFHEYV